MGSLHQRTYRIEPRRGYGLLVVETTLVETLHAQCTVRLHARNYPFGGMSSRINAFRSVRLLSSLDDHVRKPFIVPRLRLPVHGVAIHDRRPAAKIDIRMQLV